MDERGSVLLPSLPHVQLLPFPLSLSTELMSLRGEETIEGAKLPRGAHGLPTVMRPVWTPSSRIGAPFQVVQCNGYECGGGVAQSSTRDWLSVIRAFFHYLHS